MKFLKDIKGLIKKNKCSKALSSFENSTSITFGKWFFINLNKNIHISIQIHKTYFLILVFGLFAPLLFAQSQKGLETKRKRLLKDIKLTSKLLGETTKSRKATLDRFLTLKSQIKNREELLQTFQQELHLVITSIDRADEVVQSLKKDIQRLNDEYAIMLRKAYRQKVNYSKWLFIFSANDFNQGYQRWVYLRQYEKYRTRQLHLIVKTKEMLLEKRNLLAKKKMEKDSLIIAEEEQTLLVENELENKNKLLITLNKDEGRLRKELNNQRVAHEKLNIAIESVIREVMVKKRKKSRQKPKARINTSPVIEPQRLTSDFRKNRGQLPWPVKRGIITKQFGKQAHPTLNSIEITNNGIDIRTEINAKVQAVFDGEVVGIQFIPGYDYMLIIKHGDYYTVYSNLKETFVKRGSKVKTNQDIGNVSLNSQSNTAEVHFEVWRDKTRLNPSDWILKR